jgi:hypothetical protein
MTNATMEGAEDQVSAGGLSAGADASEGFFKDWGSLDSARHVPASVEPDKQEESAEQSREDDQHDEHGSPELGVVCHFRKRVLRRRQTYRSSPRKYGPHFG